MRILFYFACIFLALSCNSSRTMSSCDTFVELKDSSLVDETAWKTVPDGLQVSFGTTDRRYAKTVVPAVNTTTAWKGTGWKGERLSAQVIFWTAEKVDRVSFQFSDFKSSGSKLSSEIAQARFVRYVMTDSFGKGCDADRSPEKYPASLAPDMLDNLTCFDIPSRTVRPVWISIDIPAEAHTGIYKGTLSVLTKGKTKQKLNLEIEVQNKVLPAPAQWEYHLDLWQHPTAVARWHQVPVWSDEHYNHLRPVMKMLADAGQKVITANLNKDPWNGQCYDRYADMILWTKKTDGSWNYDYSAFDRWISFMMGLGINKMINCYSMAPWNNELDYWDEHSGAKVTVQAVPGTPVFSEVWTPFLKDFTKHLTEKGWLHITNIAMDERSPEMMKATINLVQQVAPDLGISLADNHKSYKEYPFIKDLCVKHGAKVDEADLKYRKENGLTTTYYVYCGTEYPNMFTFSPPVEAVYSAWHSVAAGYDGFLRWAYNSWVENPLLDSRYSTWPAGDTYFVYPDARSSIRFERLREGIQDAEKIRVIRDECTASGTVEANQKLKRLSDALADFSSTKAMNAEECITLVNAAKKVLNEVSE